LAKLVELFHRTHRERLAHIETHGILPPSDLGKAMPRVELLEARRKTDEFLDSLAPPDIRERRGNGIFLFPENAPGTLFGPDNRVGIKVKVDPAHCRVFDMLTYDNVLKELRRGGQENAEPHAWFYWHFSVPLADFIKHFERGRGKGWERKSGAPDGLPERIWWPEVITMKAISPKHVDVKTPLE